MSVALSINRRQSSWRDHADIEVLMAVASSSVILFCGNFPDAMYVSYLRLRSRVRRAFRCPQTRPLPANRTAPYRIHTRLAGEHRTSSRRRVSRG
jgi:hypothetical protein